MSIFNNLSKEKKLKKIEVAQTDETIESQQDDPNQLALDLGNDLESSETLPNSIALSPLDEASNTTRKLPKIIRKDKSKNKKEKSTFTPNGHAIDALMQENRHAEILIKESRRALKKIDRSPIELHWRDLNLLINELAEIKYHYQRKEELLFPKLQGENCAPLLEYFINIHKEIRKNIRNLLQAIKSSNLKNVKQTFLVTTEQIHNCITKEEQLLIPTALSQLKDEDWQEIRNMGKTIGYSWIEKDQDPLALHLKTQGIKLDGFRLDTGFMSINRMDQVFNALPVEFTVINADGIIIYYNQENTRNFKRKPKFIGESYTDCISTKNTKNIKKIIEIFKKKEQEFVDLYFYIDEQKIYVQYKPLYNVAGEYSGLIEIAQDITFFTTLEGEKREI